MHSSRNYSKNNVPYQMTLEEMYMTFRGKIEHLNHRKRYRKYTYSESTLVQFFKTLMFTRTFMKFRLQKVSRPDGHPLLGSKCGQVPWPISQKRLNEENALSAVCITAWDTHDIKKWAQSVHCRRSYSKNKVPYQIAKKRSDICPEPKLTVLTSQNSM